MKPLGSKTIHTARLTLRQVAAEDAEGLVRCRSLPMSPADTKKAVGGMLDELRKPFTFHWVITLEDVVIGRIKAWDVSPYNGYLQLGYDIAPEHRSKGYMTEAVQAITRWASLQPEVNKIEAEAEEDNIASIRVLEKSNYIRTGKKGKEGIRFVWTNEQYKQNIN